MVLVYEINANRDEVVEGFKDHQGSSIKLAEETKRCDKISLECEIEVNVYKSCVDNLEQGDIMVNLVIVVKYWGGSLTEILKGDRKLLTT